MKKMAVIIVALGTMHAEAQNLIPQGISNRAQAIARDKMDYLSVSCRNINRMPEPAKHWDLFHIGEGFFRIDGIDEDKEAELFFLGWPKMEERMGTSLSVMALKLYKPDIERIGAKDMDDMIARSPLVYQRLYGCGEQ